MGPKRLSTKNYLMIVSILLVSFILTGVSFSWTLYQYNYRRNLKSMSSTMSQALKMVNAYEAQWNAEGIEMRMAISGIGSLSGCDIILADSDGTVIACSEKGINCTHIGARLPDSLIESAGLGNANGVAVIEGVYPELRQYVCSPLSSGTGEDSAGSGYLLISMDTRSFREVWRSCCRLFMAVAAIVMALASIMTIIVSRHLSEPINEIASVSDRFARGDLEARVNETGRRDEIGRLQSSFNRMADSLENTEKIRRELIGNVSHDLKTPITTITGFTEGILDGTIPPELEKDYLKKISSEAQRMSRMVQNMLAMSRMQDLDPAEILRGSFDICEMMRIALINMESRIDSKKLDVELSLPEEEMTVQGDSDSITRVITNLIDNAVKFADTGSTLKLEIWKQNGKAYVSVADKGAVIPQEELPKIFDRFHKSDASRSMDKNGSGLGLFIVKSIISSHHEDIFVSSTPEETRFIFTLTLRPADKQNKNRG